MCELYCPVDALYVAPQADALVEVDEDALVGYWAVIGKIWAGDEEGHLPLKKKCLHITFLV
jgi:hypothetical protein